MGRVEIRASVWEPVNDDADAGNIDWQFFEKSENDSSELREAFEMGRILQNAGIPVCASIWAMPEWLYSNTGVTHGRIIDEKKWPEMAECIVSYLLRAKNKYGWEPDYFSFNEPDYGVNVKFDPAVYPGMLNYMGRAFAGKGIKTKFLLGDTTTPRALCAYIDHTTRVRDVMQSAGAIGFHSWGGASQAEYQAIRSLATGLDLPLIVSETGFDASAYKTPWIFDSWYYALSDLRNIQELLCHAMPHSMLYWEYTSDYSLFLHKRNSRQELIPGPRYWFIKHYMTMTFPSRYVHAESTSSDLLVSVLEPVDVKTGGGLTIHIANFGTTCRARLKGLPSGSLQFRQIRTSRTESFRELNAVEKRNEFLVLDLLGNSLTTLISR